MCVYGDLREIFDERAGMTTFSSGTESLPFAQINNSYDKGCCRAKMYVIGMSKR
jgi:hypothetical protein